MPIKYLVIVLLGREPSNPKEPPGDSQYSTSLLCHYFLELSSMNLATTLLLGNVLLSCKTTQKGCGWCPLYHSSKTSHLLPQSGRKPFGALAWLIWCWFPSPYSVVCQAQIFNSTEQEANLKKIYIKSTNTTYLSLCYICLGLLRKIT